MNWGRYPGIGVRRNQFELEARDFRGLFSSQCEACDINFALIAILDHRPQRTIINPIHFRCTYPLQIDDIHCIKMCHVLCLAHPLFCRWPLLRVCNMRFQKDIVSTLPLPDAFNIAWEEEEWGMGVWLHVSWRRKIDKLKFAVETGAFDRRQIHSI